MQDITTADLPWSVAHSIAALSAFMTLQPGDMIALGAAPHPASGAGPPRWLRPGDRVTVHIEGIGLCDCPVHQKTLPR